MLKVFDGRNNVKHNSNIDQIIKEQAIADQFARAALEYIPPGRQGAYLRELERILDAQLSPRPRGCNRILMLWVYLANKIVRAHQSPHE